MSLLQTIFQPILSNQFATGMGLTAAIGAAAYHARALPNLLMRGCGRVMTVSVAVSSRDPAFVWIDRWLAAQPYAQRATNVTLKSWGEDDDRDWMLTIGEGAHFFWWNGRPVQAVRKRPEKPSRGNDIGASDEGEWIYLKTLGRSQEALRAMISEAKRASLSSESVQIRTWRGWWCQVRGRRSRPLGTIILNRGQAERLIADVERFLASRQTYSRRGVPWRRGYLFSGPPGTGKTSFVIALAGYLRRPICMLNIGSLNGDEALFAAVSEAPPDAILLIEDIDCIQAAAPRSVGMGEEPEGLAPPVGAISKAALLNALDGVATPEGRILIMTTNRPEMLDGALVRPGRADVHEVFDCLDEEAQLRMASLFGAVHFIPSREPIAAAELQGRLLSSAGHFDTH